MLKTTGKFLVCQNLFNEYNCFNWLLLTGEQLCCAVIPNRCRTYAKPWILSSFDEHILHQWHLLSVYIFFSTGPCRIFSVCILSCTFLYVFPLPFEGALNFSMSQDQHSTYWSINTPMHRFTGVRSNLAKSVHHCFSIGKACGKWNPMSLEAYSIYLNLGTQN